MSVSGSVGAEDALAARYNQLVRICARPYFLAGGDSEDLTQEGMLGLLSAIREYRPAQGVPFKAYAELCIRRRIFSAIKSASCLKHIPLNSGVSLEDAFGSEGIRPGMYAALDLRNSPEEQVLARERTDEFFQTFSRCLSPFEQKILPLYLAGYSYSYMAAASGRTEKAVDNAIQRIRRKLSRITFFRRQQRKLNAISSPRAESKRGSANVRRQDPGMQRVRQRVRFHRR